MAEKCEEGCDCEGLIAGANDLKVYGMPVPAEGQQRSNGVDGHHKQDAYDTKGSYSAFVARKATDCWGDILPLLIRLGIVQRMHPYEIGRDQTCYERCRRADNQAELMKVQVAGNRDLSHDYVARLISKDITRSRKGSLHLSLRICSWVSSHVKFTMIATVPCQH